LLDRKAAGCHVALAKDGRMVAGSYVSLEMLYHCRLAKSLTERIFIGTTKGGKQKRWPCGHLAINLFELGYCLMLISLPVICSPFIRRV
jgi:hypothetical protein